MAEESTVPCNLCLKSIPFKDYQLHEQQCFIQDELPEPVLFSSSIIKSTLISQKQDSQESVDEQEVPCPNCSKNLKFTELDSHDAQCEGRSQACQHCQEIWPFTLMSEHLQSCPKALRAIATAQQFQINTKQRSQSFQITSQKTDGEGQLKDKPYAQQNELFRFKNKLIQAQQQIAQQNKEKNSQSQQQQQQQDNNNHHHRPAASFLPIPTQFQQQQQQQQQKLIPPNPLQQRVRPPMPMHREAYKLTQQNAEALNEKLNQLLDNGGEIPELEDHDLSNVGGLQQQQIDELFGITKYLYNIQLNEEQTKCAVCLEEYLKCENIRILPCAHRFHINCCDVWVMKNPTCPVCKTDLRKFV